MKKAREKAGAVFKKILKFLARPSQCGNIDIKAIVAQLQTEVRKRLLFIK